MRTSTIKQVVSCKRPEFKNSSAELKTSVLSPIESIRSYIASRTDSSSSTTEIRGSADTPFSHRCDSLWANGSFIGSWTDSSSPTPEIHASSSNLFFHLSNSLCDALSISQSQYQRTS